MKHAALQTRLGGALLALTLSAAPLAAYAQSAMTILVTGVRSSKGSIRVDICTRETFLKKVCAYSGRAPAEPGVTSVTIENVPPGAYAVQAYHDLNDNNDVDQGLLGIPKEGIAFSNNAPLGQIMIDRAKGFADTGVIPFKGVNYGAIMTKVQDGLTRVETGQQSAADSWNQVVSDIKALG